MNIAVSELSLVIDALSFAARKHRNQRRKDKTETPYIKHPIEVVNVLWNIGKVRDLNILAAGILHDTLEDTDTTPEELDEKFSVFVRKIVEEVSDDKSQPKKIRRQQQIDKAENLSYYARHIKLADKICNIEDLLYSPPDNWSSRDKKEYIDWCFEVVKKVRGVNLKLERYFDGIYIEVKRSVT